MVKFEECGGRRGEITIIEEIDGLVGGECMKLREEQAQMVRKRRRKGETSFSRIGHIWRNRCGPMSVETEGKSRRESNNRISHAKINEADRIKELYKVIGEFTEPEKEKHMEERQKAGEEEGARPVSRTPDRLATFPRKFLRKK